MSIFDRRREDRDDVDEEKKDDRHNLIEYTSD